MKIKQLKPGILFLIGPGLAGIQAQDGAIAAACNALGSGGLVSYSIGQATHQTHSGTGSSTAGAEQPFEIYVASGTKKAEWVLLSVSAYPNPVTDHLQLNIRGIDLSDLSF